MLRVKLSKLKQVCATAFLPRILKDSKSAKNKIECAIEYLSKARKSSDSGSKDEEYEKQMRIIEKCFGERPPQKDIKEYKDDTKELLHKNILRTSPNENKIDDKHKALISKIFGTDINEEVQRDHLLQATTAKIEEEKLAQKIDHIEETSHVEAGVPKVEGFNSTPKVLGGKSSTLDVSELRHDTPSDQCEQVNLDELAKRCLGSPVGEIDKILLSEQKNLSHDSSRKVKLTIPSNDSAQKYFSQIFERKTKNDIIISDISDTHLKQDESTEIKSLKENSIDQFQPFYLDTVPVFAINENGMIYEENKHKTEYSLPGIKNLLLDIPAVLEPYDMQAIPFYEYVNKENLILKDDPALEKVPLTETIQETEVNTPTNEEIILHRGDFDKQNAQMKNETEVETEEPKPFITKAVEPLIKANSTKSAEISNLSESDVLKLLEYRQVLTTKPKAIASVIPNIVSNKCSAAQKDPQRVLTSRIDKPTDSDTFENESGNSAISNAFPPSSNKRSVDLPENTAISANQNPGEYFELPKDSFQFQDIRNEQTVSLYNDTIAAHSTIMGTLANDNIASDTKDSTVSDSTSTYSKLSDNIANETDSPDKITAATDSKATDAIISDHSHADDKTIDSVVSVKPTDVKARDAMINDTTVASSNVTDTIFSCTKVSESLISGINAVDPKADNTVVSDGKNIKNKVTNSAIEDRSPLSMIDADTKLNSYRARVSDTMIGNTIVPDTTVNFTEPTINKTSDTIANANTTSDTKVADPGVIDTSVTNSTIKNKADTNVTDTKLNSNRARLSDTMIGNTIVPDTTFNFTEATITITSDNIANAYTTYDTKAADPGVIDVSVTNSTLINKADTKNDNVMSQSTAYLTMPKLLEVEEDSKQSDTDSKSEIPFIDGNEPITPVFVQPETKREDSVAQDSQSCSTNDRSICSQDTMPLSILLKQVRERHRLQLLRTAYFKSEAQPEEANKNRCIPPLDRSKPKTKLHPKPCQPKPKSDPCKPAKKDPCAKYVPLFLDTIITSSTNISIPSEYYSHTLINPLKLTQEMVIKKINQTTKILDFLRVKHDVEDHLNDVVCARDFDPWVPIPSWPMPKVEKKPPLVCPKDGCKLPVRPIPSNTEKPCIGMPKKLSPTKVFFTPILHDEN